MHSRLLIVVATAGMLVAATPERVRQADNAARPTCFKALRASESARKPLTTFSFEVAMPLRYIAPCVIKSCLRNSIGVSSWAMAVL